MFHPNFPLSELRPAPYDPRQISPEAIEQKFHTIVQARELGNRIIGADAQVIDYDQDSEIKGEFLTSSFFCVIGTKTVELTSETVKRAIRFQYNLSFPESQRFARANDVLMAFDKNIDP